MTHPFCPSNFCLSGCPIGQSCHRILVDFPMFDMTGFSCTDNGYQEMVSVTLFLLLIKPIPKGVNIAKDKLHQNNQAVQFSYNFCLHIIAYQLKVFVEYTPNINTKRKRLHFPILSIPIIATNLVHQPATF
jgi:hypothetical protein